MYMNVLLCMCMLGGWEGESDERWSLGSGSILQLFWGDLFLIVQSFKSFMYVSL